MNWAWQAHLSRKRQPAERPAPSCRDKMSHVSRRQQRTGRGGLGCRVLVRRDCQRTWRRRRSEFMAHSSESRLVHASVRIGAVDLVAFRSIARLVASACRHGAVCVVRGVTAWPYLHRDRRARRCVFVRADALPRPQVSRRTKSGSVRRVFGAVCDRFRRVRRCGLLVARRMPRRTRCFAKTRRPIIHCSRGKHPLRRRAWVSARIRAL